VAGCRECGDIPSGAGATDLVIDHNSLPVNRGCDNGTVVLCALCPKCNL
jgi:hypothetical protein